MQRAFGAIIIALVCATLACSAADTNHAVPSADAQSTAAVPRATAAARTAVERRYGQHFAAGQGFTVDTLRARQAWFTPRLYRRMLADMTPAGEIGYIEADPFTDAQDDAAGFTVGAASAAHDTVLVAVAVAFPPTAGGGQAQRHVTLAMVPGRGGWRIANFIYPDRDLASGLVGAAPRE